MVYNLNYEQELINIMEKSKDTNHIRRLLNDYYQKTKYPGALYWVARNMEDYINYDKEEAASYHKQAAQEGYRSSMVWMAEYYMNKGADYLIEAEDLIMQAIEDLRTMGALLIQAKIYLLQAIYHGETGKYQKAMKIINKLQEYEFPMAEEFINIIESQDDMNLLN